MHRPEIETPPELLEFLRIIERVGADDPTAVADALRAWFADVNDLKLNVAAATLCGWEDAMAEVEGTLLAVQNAKIRLELQRAVLVAELKAIFARNHWSERDLGPARLTREENGGPLPVIFDAERFNAIDLPPRFRAVKAAEPTYAPKLIEMRRALEAGERLPFARLGERGWAIKVHRKDQPEEWVN